MTAEARGGQLGGLQIISSNVLLVR